MQKLGIIEHLESAWGSPIVLVPKKDGSLRFCINFHQVNAEAHFDAYLIRRLEG